MRGSDCKGCGWPVSKPHAVGCSRASPKAARANVAAQAFRLPPPKVEAAPVEPEATVYQAHPEDF